LKPTFFELPTTFKRPDFKSRASTNSATRAYKPLNKIHQGNLMLFYQMIKNMSIHYYLNRISHQ